MREHSARSRSSFLSSPRSTAQSRAASAPAAVFYGSPISPNADFILVAITGALTYFTTLFGASRDVTKTAAVISTALTIAIMWRVSAAIGLYWMSSTAVGAVQALWLRRDRKL